jgi:hypothetical protein
MNDTRSNIIITLFSVIPYLLVSWGYTALVDGAEKQFWGAFGVLIAVRLFFSVIETLSGVLSWHLYSKRLMINKFLRLLWENNYPKRTYKDEDFLDYLSRIEDGTHSDTLKKSAKEFYSLLSTFESMGILLGIRMHSASQAALEIYSPKAETTITKEQDERDFWEHWRKGDAIRAKYDPGNEWNEATFLPQEYLDEINKLNLEYQGVLRRRNRWTDSDFDN